MSVYFEGVRPTNTIVLFSCWKLEWSASAHSMVLLRGDPMGRQTSILSCCSLRRLPSQGGSLQIFRVGSGLTRAETGKPAFQRQLVGCKCSVYLFESKDL